MTTINPLTQEQANTLTPEMSKVHKPFRVLANGQAVNICSGVCCSKGSNVMYHPVYFDRPKVFVNRVVVLLQKNNPGVCFTVRY